MSKGLSMADANSAPLRNAILIVDGDYLLGGMNPSNDEDMAAFKRHVSSMMVSKEQAFRCHFNISQRVVYFTEDLLGQVSSHHSGLSQGSIADRAKMAEDRIQTASRQALLTALKKERYTVIVLNQTGGPITSGKFCCVGAWRGDDAPVVVGGPYASPIDAAVSSRIMAVVARQTALLACDRKRWAPTCVSDVMLFAKQGYYEAALEALSGEGPLAVFTSVDPSALDNTDATPTRVSVHMSCFEGDTVDDNLLPYLSDEVQLQIPKGANGGLYAPITGGPQLRTTTQDPSVSQPAISSAPTQAVVPPTVHQQPKMSTAELMKNLFDDDETVVRGDKAVPQMATPPSEVVMPKDTLPAGIKEVYIDQSGIACPGVSTLLPVDTGIYFDQLYRRHYYVANNGANNQQTSWEHPLGPDHQEHVEKQVLAWWKLVQTGSLKQNSGNNFNPNIDIKCQPLNADPSSLNLAAVVTAPMARTLADTKPKTEVLSSATVRPQTMLLPSSQPATPTTPSSTPAPSTPFTNNPTTVHAVPTTVTQPAAAVLTPNPSPTTPTIPRVEQIRTSLPSGWDCREVRRQNGSVRIVYIDHASKATSWEGPPGWVDPTL